MKAIDTEVDVSSVSTDTSARLDKLLCRLPAFVRPAASAIAGLASDPWAEKSCFSRQRGQEIQSANWGWLPMLTFISALGVFLVAYDHTSARFGATNGNIFFWSGLLLIWGPIVARLLSPRASRFERLTLLCVAGLCLYIVNMLGNPTAFSNNDELQHWRTINDIASSRHLFTPNALLPVSPFYPGLEIVTHTLRSLSGLEVFPAGLIVVGTARLLMMLSLFLFFEQISKSARTAGIATAFYMLNPHFLFYDAKFLYESLAIPLAAFVLAMLACSEIQYAKSWKVLLSVGLTMAAIVVTHHLTDFVLIGLLLLWIGVRVFQRAPRALHSNITLIALLGIGASIAWMSFPDNPVVEYLSTYINDGLHELFQVLGRSSSPRQLFTDYGGQQSPLWQRIVALFSIGFISITLPFGLLCLWLRYRLSTLAWMLGIFATLYPFIHIFRLTSSGIELADRPTPFIFIALALTFAVLIVQFWPIRSLHWPQITFISCVLCILFLGGVIMGAGPIWAYEPGPYLVGTDTRSIGPEGIQTALWTREYLGSDNRILTDGVNRLLQGTYSSQQLVTGSSTGIDLTPIFLSQDLDSLEIMQLKQARTQYIIVDLRLSTALPKAGIYFEQGELNAFKYTSPIMREALTKFDAMPGVDRVFDSGNIVIYDIRELINAS